VDEWLVFVDEQLQSTDFKALDGAYKKINKHLTLRSYIAGYEPTAADFAVWGAMKGMCSCLAVAFEPPPSAS
jgi:glutamyl-tRNA synthetase